MYWSQLCRKKIRCNIHFPNMLTVSVLKSFPKIKTVHE